MLRRDRFLNHLDRQDGSIICWISRDLRAEDHWGLILAQQEALRQNQPLIVVFCLQVNFLGALPRAFSFLLSGLEETARALSRLNIPLIVLRGPPQDVLPAFCHRVSAGVVYCDFSPLRLSREWRTQLARRLTVQLIEVDAHNIIPCWLASDHQEYAAHTFRPKVNRQLDQWLVGFPPMQRHPFLIADDISMHAGLSKAQLAQQWKLLHEQFHPWMSSPISGSNAGKIALESFLNSGLIRYGLRNDPNAHASSRLSAWLHFGQLAPQRVALEVQKLTKASDGNDKPIEEQQADFLEELIVRRELADNFCFYNQNYDQINAFPEWARTTLRQHQADPRPHIYSLNELESAETTDPIWNAAQQEIINSGWMPGYLRMYWAKKILEWSIDAETAQTHAIALNDRYLLDGRDPNGYAGIAWSIGGTHDRAWNERPIFGKVRIMTYAGCRRKFNVDQYIQNASAG